MPASATLVTEEALKGLLGPGADNEQVKLCVEATEAYVERYLGARDEQRPTWSSAEQLGARKLARNLYRDSMQSGIAAPYEEPGMFKRATDVEIEQLLRIGRYAPPRVG